MTLPPSTHIYQRFRSEAGRSKRSARAGETPSIRSGEPDSSRATGCADALWEFARINITAPRKSPRPRRCRRGAVHDSAQGIRLNRKYRTSKRRSRHSQRKIRALNLRLRSLNQKCATALTLGATASDVYGACFRLSRTWDDVRTCRSDASATQYRFLQLQTFLSDEIRSTASTARPGSADSGL